MTAHRHSHNILQVDVTKEAEVEVLVKAAVAWSGRLDVMINNAGIHIVGTVDAFSEAGMCVCSCLGQQH